MVEGHDKPAGEDSSDEGISLQQLSDAFAEMLKDDGETDAAPADSDLDEASDSDENSSTSRKAEGDESCPISPKTVLEAILFVGHPENAPLSREHAAKILHGTEPDEIPAIVDELNAEYAELGHPYRIVSEGAGYRLSLAEEYGRVRDRFYGRQRQARLSQAAIETLALVAYNQPVTGDVVSRMRGHPSGAVLSQLVRRRLLRIERPDEKPRRPRYFTTERFLQLFGLERLDDLPRSQEVGP